MYFFDPVFRGPIFASMLMCLAASLVGVVIFLRRQSLIGEALSHAAYPGIILGIITAALFGFDELQETWILLFIMSGAFATGLLGLWTIHFLEKQLKIRSDSALCFVLSTFFGVGVTMASHIQFSHTSLYRVAQSYLYGQVATMTDQHVLIYAGLSLAIAVTLFSLRREIQMMIFNSDYAKSLGINVRMINFLCFILTVLIIVVGIRSVGVILMSAMLIAPAAAARQFTHRFSMMLLLASLFGVISGLLGNYASIWFTQLLQIVYPASRLSIPTGPAIVLIAALIALISLLFAPERGLISRAIRILHFRYRIIQENILKTLWRNNKKMGMEELSHFQNISKPFLNLILFSLKRNGWIDKVGREYQLTHDGQQRAAHIIRLHRLWELYLADYLGAGVERVHCNAEEMEHIITPELEQQLTDLLKNPTMDPHHQTIPSKEQYEL